MLALFVKIPTMQRLQKIRSFSADSKYSADHISLLRLPHLRYSRTLQPAQPYWQIAFINKTIELDNEKAWGTYIRNIRAQP